MPLSKFTCGLIGGFALLGATSISISFSLAKTSGAGTRFVLRGGEVAGLSEREVVEKSVTVLLSWLSWRVWYVVLELAVEDRVVVLSQW